MSRLQEGFTKAGFAQAQRHLFLCLGPDCCESRAGEVLWDYVKKRTKEVALKAMRTKAGCFPHLHGRAVAGRLSRRHLVFARYSGAV
jgi:hypothetical protein